MKTEINDVMRGVPNKRQSEGELTTGSGFPISDKDMALEMFDKDYPIFIVDENGEQRLAENRADIENHSGVYSSSTGNVVEFLAKDLTEDTQKEQEIQRREDERKAELEDGRMAAIAACIGLSVSQLGAVPNDVKEDIFAEYDRNVGILSGAALAASLNSILDGKPVQNNYLQTVEELTEANYNSIDGIINNKPPDNLTTERPSVIRQIADIQSSQKSHSSPISQREL